MKLFSNKKLLILGSFILAINLAFFICSERVLASSEGPLFAGTGATSSDSGGTTDWTCPNKIVASDSDLTISMVGRNGSPKCLHPDTLIATTNGERKIKDLRIGDLVYSYNFSRERVELKRISDISITPISYYGNKYYHIYFSGGDLKVAFSHLFYVGGKIIKAEDLKVGDFLLGMSGEKKIITGINIEENHTDYLYNISVNDNHNFFAEGVLVHNAGVYDHRVRIIKNGAIGTTDKATADAWPLGSDIYATYGGSSDLWGETWTPSDVNSANFGVAISAYGTGYTYNYTSYYLLASNFGFNIPSIATINGITAEIQKSYDYTLFPMIFAEVNAVRITVTYTADSTPPTISSFSPDDGSQNVAVDSNLTITFSETVNAQTGNIRLYKNEEDTLVQNFNVATDIEGSGSDTIAINPSSNLLGETEYYVKIDATAFDDASGNSFAGVDDKTEWNFTTADISAPEVSGLSPADDSQDIVVSSNLTITFSEDIATGTGDIVIHKSNGDEVESFSANSSDKITVSGNEAVINPTSDFDYETSYYILINNGAFKDSSSNSYAGISDSTQWNFTTQDTPACPAIANAATYNSYPVCGIASCEGGYTLVNGSCNAIGGNSLPITAFSSPVPPIGGFGVSLSQNTGKTASRIITLKFNAGPNTDKVAISFTGDFKDAVQEKYIPLKQIDLCSKFGGFLKNTLCPDGQYLIYAKFYTAYGKESEVVSTSVNLSTSEKSSPRQTSPLSKNLNFGAIDEQVRNLQKFLNQNGYPLAESGVGSPGQETEYFGLLTLEALFKFQKANKEKISGITEENGYFGPLTRQLINSFTNQTLLSKSSIKSSSINVISAKFVKNLVRGEQSEDVLRLQKLLASLPEIYPEKIISGYFGPLTEKAVRAFQLKYGVVNSEPDPGFGVVGPKTRAILFEVFENSN